MVNFSSIARATTRVVGSAMLGVATVVLAKSHADDHWSVSPKVTIQSDSAGDSHATPDVATSSREAVAA